MARNNIHNPFDPEETIRRWGGPLSRKKLRGLPDEIRCARCQRKLMEIVLPDDESPLSPGACILIACRRCGAKNEVTYMRDARGIQRIKGVRVVEE